MQVSNRLFNFSAPLAIAIALAIAGVGGALKLPEGFPGKVKIELGITGLGARLLAVQAEGGEQFRYDTVAVDRGTIRKVVSTSGPVRALVTVSVGSQISGQIDKLNADFNSEVKAGDVLALIDARTFEARVSQARADLKAARAGLDNQEALLKRNEAVRDQAERASERQEVLQKKGFATTATMENANKDLSVAVADIAVAKAQIESARAGIAQREAALQQAEIDLERTKIVAPVNGTVISRTVDVGQTVAASLQAPELFKIAQDLRHIRIESQVNEADVGLVAEGNKVSFTVDAYPDRTFEGKVSQIRLSAVELNNVVTYTVLIEASNDDRKLYPGMTANAQIEVATKEGVLRVANDAVRFKPKVEIAAGGPGDRSERMVTRLRDGLHLTSAQEQAVREELKKLAAERSKAPGSTQADVADPAAQRQRMQAAVERIIRPLLTAEQEPLFENWKRGRENTKAGGIYVLGSDGRPDRRFVRLGVSDDKFTEIAGGPLEENERVIVRSRAVEQ